MVLQDFVQVNCPLAAQVYGTPVSQFELERLFNLRFNSCPPGDGQDVHNGGKIMQ
jgi:hypothetical protein